MPRRTTHTSKPEGRTTERTIKVEKPNFLQQTKDFFADPRTRMVAGLLLITIALFLLIACVSYFFTGTSDQSLLQMSYADRKEHRVEIQNWLGLPGAAVAEFLLNGAFGWLAFALIAMLIIYALRLLHIGKVHPLRTLLTGTFVILWGDVLLGFAQLLIEKGSFCWGGAFGQWFAGWLNSYIQPTGMIISLLVTLVIFLIIAEKNFIPNMKRLGLWFAGLFKRKPKDNTTETTAENNLDTTDNNPEENTEEHPQDTSEDDSIEIYIDGINDTAVAQPAAVSDDPDDIPFVIDTPTEEEIHHPAPQDTTDMPDDTPAADNGADISIEDTQPVELVKDTPEDILAKLGPYDPRKDLEYYKFPALDLLKVYDNETGTIINRDEQNANAKRIVETLRNFGIEIEKITATVGPTVTLYELSPKAGIKISKIKGLENDIMMSLSAIGIRMIAPIPGKGTVGVEVPNEHPQTVSMHSVIASKRFQEEKKMRLPIAIGRTITNEVFMFDLAKTPHLLVAGATGQGKSVAINAILTSLLYKKHPAELKLVLVDPKMVEFSPYKGLYRHYLAAMPEVEENDIIITDCDKVINTLNSLVIEMENRYKLLMDAGVRNLEDYNDKFINRRLNPEKLVADSLHHRYLPYIVIVIDEYGDFIMQAGKQVETPIARITQKARAVGMHMILATQRPSVNIVTGVIKANIPTRIALRTQSQIDSRTVLDATGAEHLIGRGDMLYAANGNITRIQCAFVDTPEVDAIVDHISQQQRYFEPYQLPEYIPEGAEEALAPGSVDLKRLDPMFADVARYVVAKQEGSTSRLQRAFEIGYNRAGKLSDQLEAAGIVGPNKGPKGRDVLIQDMDMLEQKLQELGAS